MLGDLETKVIEKCPVFLSGDVKKMLVREIQCLGLTSGDCEKCGGYDNHCKIYQDFIREN